MPSYSIVQFFPDDEEDLGHECGYCSQKDTSISTGEWEFWLSLDKLDFYFTFSSVVVGVVVRRKIDS